MSVKNFNNLDSSESGRMTGKNALFAAAARDFATADIPDAGRRLLLKGLGAAMLTAGLSFTLDPGTVRAETKENPRILVIGCGVGGATFAKYMKMFCPEAEIVAMDRNPLFIRHYGSSEVLTGAITMEDLHVSYDGLRKRGITVVQETAVSLDPDRKTVGTASGKTFDYDFLVISPGIELLYGSIEGYTEEIAETRVPCGWIAGPQTQLLRNQLLAMPEKGTFILCAPPNPYRCPPGPYERTALVTEWTAVHKPGTRIVVLDPKNEFVTDETMLIGWNHLYDFVPPEPYYSKLKPYLKEPEKPSRIEWHRMADGGKPVALDVDGMVVATENGETYHGDVITAVPAMKAARFVRDMGLADKSGFCPINRMNFESTIAPNVYILGDASIADAMPKSGFSANTQAKVAARAITETLAGRPIPEPAWSNTCYALAGDEWGLFVADIFRIVDGKIARTNTRDRYQFLTATDGERRAAARFLRSWIRTITMDSFF